MFRFKGCRFLQGIHPGLRRLARKRRHEIHINIGKARLSGQLKAVKELPPGMDPSQRLQFPVIG